MADNLTGHAICPQCCFCGHSVANPGDMCGMCAGSIAAHQLRLARAAADNLTDAQKIMRDVLAGHRMSLGMTFYRDGTCKLPTCSCGETMHPNGHPRHVAVAVDEALGGLTRETNRHPLGTEHRFIGGWTPEETPNA